MNEDIIFRWLKDEAFIDKLHGKFFTKRTVIGMNNCTRTYVYIDGEVYDWNRVNAVLGDLGRITSNWVYIPSRSRIAKNFREEIDLLTRVKVIKPIYESHPYYKRKEVLIDYWCEGPAMDEFRNSVEQNNEPFFEIDIIERYSNFDDEVQSH